MSVVPGARRVPGYPVTKDELERIGEAGAQTQTFYALAAFFASFALSTLLDGALATELTPAGTLVNTFGPWLFGVVAIAFGWLGFVSSQRRQTLLDGIVDQTKHDPKSDE